MIPWLKKSRLGLFLYRLKRRGRFRLVIGALEQAEVLILRLKPVHLAHNRRQRVQLRRFREETRARQNRSQ